MSKTFEAFTSEDRRLVILRTLRESQGYAMNCSVMQMALKGFGHSVSRDQVRTDFAWLKEQGLVSIEMVAEAVHVATITARGADVAQGHSSVPGVRRPGPEG